MTVRTVNDTGIGSLGGPEDKIKDLRVYCEGSAVQFWVELRDGTECFQYLTAKDAMAFSIAFERLAIEALIAEAELAIN